MKNLFYITLLCLSAGIFSCQNSINENKNGQAVNASVSVDEFEKKLSGKDIQLIDVRTSDEFNQGHLKNALNFDINSDEFQSQIAKLDKSNPVLVYCLSGGRSASAAELMASEGFKEVYNMQGGIMKWTAANKPLDNGGVDNVNTGMSAEDFNKLIDSDKYVLIDYNAKWCQPCKKMAPFLQSFADNRKDKLVLVKIDADENKSLLQQKGIESIPVLELYRNGQLVWKHVGEIGETELINEIKL